MTSASKLKKATAALVRDLFRRQLDEIGRPPLSNEHYFDHVYRLSISVIEHFLGSAWIDNLVVNKSAQLLLNGKLVETDDSRRAHLVRYMDLADMLINLRLVGGFDRCIRQLKGGDIQGTYAELETAKFLHRNRVLFRFVEQKKPSIRNYDLQVLFRGSWIASEIKCKLDDTEKKKASIINSLNDARKQLPRDKPGFVFLRLPADWLWPEFNIDIVSEAIADFLRGTKRVASVKMHSQIPNLIRDVPAWMCVCREYNNPSLSTQHGWDLWQGRPANNWHTLASFVRGAQIGMNLDHLDIFHLGHTVLTGENIVGTIGR